MIKAASTYAQNGTDKDSQEGLRWNTPGKRKQGRPKMTLRKTFEGDLEKMELTWGTAEREAKEKISWRKRIAALSSMDRSNIRRRRM